MFLNVFPLRWLLAACMPLYLSKSKSSSASSTSNQDNRIVADGGSVVAAGGSHVNVTATDYGAVKSSLELVGAVDERRTKSLEDLLGFAGDVFDSGLEVLDGAGRQVQAQTQLVAQAYDTAKGAGDQKTILTGVAIAAVVIVAITVLKK